MGNDIGNTASTIGSALILLGMGFVGYLVYTNSFPKSPLPSTPNVIDNRNANANKVLVYNTSSSESRTILPIRMLLPNGKWSEPVKYNFDTGASWPTDVAPQFLSAFGYGSDGVGNSSNRKEQRTKIQIVGLDSEFDIPIMVQDKSHYDLFREQPPPTRYPLLRVIDILPNISMVFSSNRTVLRLKGVPVPELSHHNRITLPDFQQRSGTPTSGWQWMKVRFKNPTDTTSSITDWFGLNTGDRRIILKKESIGDKIRIPSVQKDSCNYESKCTLEFIEASAPVVLNSSIVELRKESCRFARGGEARNIGGGVPFLQKYTMVLWDMHRILIPN